MEIGEGVVMVEGDNACDSSEGMRPLYAGSPRSRWISDLLVQGLTRAAVDINDIDQPPHRPSIADLTT